MKNQTFIGKVFNRVFFSEILLVLSILKVNSRQHPKMKFSIFLLFFFYQSFFFFTDILLLLSIQKAIRKGLKKDQMYFFPDKKNRIFSDINKNEKSYFSNQSFFLTAILLVLSI